MNYIGGTTMNQVTVHKRRYGLRESQICRKIQEMYKKELIRLIDNLPFKATPHIS